MALLSAFRRAADKRLIAKLNKLPVTVRRRIAKTAAKAGQEPIREAAKQKAPVGRGKLRKQIRIRAGGRGKPGTTISKVGVFSKTRGAVARYVEFGRYDEKKGGLYQPPKPFLRPAHYENEKKAIKIVRQVLKSEITKFLRIYNR